MEDKRTWKYFQAIHLYDMPINVTTLNSRKYLTRQKIQEFDSTWKNHRKYKNTKLHSFMKTNKFIHIDLFYFHTMQNTYIQSKIVVLCTMKEETHTNCLYYVSNSTRWCIFCAFMYISCGHFSPYFFVWDICYTIEFL